MVEVEPVAGTATATVSLPTGTALLVADYHAGLERALRYRDGVSVHSREKQRRQRLLSVIEDTGATELIVVGDLMHSIGEPTYSERTELEALIEAIPSRVEVTVIKGNHDGDIEQWLEGATVHEAPGTVVDGLALSHGHTWPPEAALGASVLVIGHEHPQVRLEDSVGGATVHRVWLRGRLDGTVIAEHLDIDPPERNPELIVMPAFNELSGGTWINVDDEDFLVPYLPAALYDVDAYLLDGTNLGRRETLLDA